MNLSKYETSPTLTLGDSETFVKRGGMIQIHIEDNKPKIYVNNAAAKRKN